MTPEMYLCTHRRGPCVALGFVFWELMYLGVFLELAEFISAWTAAFRMSHIPNSVGFESKLKAL